MSANAENVGANASQDTLQTTEVVEEVVEQPRRERYELDNDSESEAGSPPAGEEKAESKTPDDDTDGVQKRINELTKNWRNAERELANFQQGQFQVPPDQQQQPKEGEQQDPFGIPPIKSLADFDYDENEYLKYNDQRTQALVAVQTQQALHMQQQQAEARKRMAVHQDREGKFANETPDYWQVVQNVPVTPIMRQAIETSDIGPEVVYYLGKHPEVAQAIAYDHPIEQARKLAALEYEFRGAKKSAARNEVSSAPPPAKTVKGSNPGRAVGASDANSDKLSDEEWLKRRNKEVRERR